ncbi:MAG: hypothetical protein U0572_00575 [Phycisphaerales bacterium]
MSIAISIVAVLSLSVGAPPPEAAPQNPAPPPPGPRLTAGVNLDPEHPEPVEGWWSNGTQMIELAPGGAYRLFAGQNRYEKPLEVGRWSRQNYAVFWLEPYSSRKEQRTRVSLSKLDDATMIHVRTFAPMTHIDAPPLSEEDFVIGLWVGDGGSLELEPTMRYRFVAPSRPTEGQPVVIASHRGTWRLRDARVELVPDSPSVTPVSFEPIRDADGTPYMRLRGVEGTLDRVIERKPDPKTARDANSTTTGSTPPVPPAAPAPPPSATPKS